MTEKQIERRMCKIIKERGGLTYKFTSSNNPGVPDRIVITPAGVVWFVELKTLRGKLSVIQGQRIHEIAMRNANVTVLYGWDAVEKFIDEVLPYGV